MTYPLIGNYGINPEDIESRSIFLEGFIVKEASRIRSNWRSCKQLDEYLKENNIVGIEGIDTRALTKHIRLQGAMKAVISTDDMDNNSLIKKARLSPGLLNRDLVKEVTCKKSYRWSQRGKYHVVVIDCGVKLNILRSLANNNCRVTVVSYRASKDEIMAYQPDGVVISNGPGDPAAVPYVVETIKGLVGRLPIFGICLGQQLIGLAFEGKTYKLKFGHHGANHPVKDLRTGRISITVQNHGFCVDINSLKSCRDMEITHINLNDNTLEGIRHKKLPIFSVQFHPEASAGPHDASYLFQEFVEMIEANAKKN
jgi:carbamoyl-phosphate synthase small subunit